MHRNHATPKDQHTDDVPTARRFRRGQGGRSAVTYFSALMALFTSGIQRRTRLYAARESASTPVMTQADHDRLQAAQEKRDRKRHAFAARHPELALVSRHVRPSAALL